MEKECAVWALFKLKQRIRRRAVHFKVNVKYGERLPKFPWKHGPMRNHKDASEEIAPFNFSPEKNDKEVSEDIDSFKVATAAQKRPYFTFQRPKGPKVRSQGTQSSPASYNDPSISNPANLSHESTLLCEVKPQKKRTCLQVSFLVSTAVLRWQRNFIRHSFLHFPIQPFYHIKARFHCQSEHSIWPCRKIFKAFPM